MILPPDQLECAFLQKPKHQDFPSLNGDIKGWCWLPPALLQSGAELLQNNPQGEALMQSSLGCHCHIFCCHIHPGPADQEEKQQPWLRCQSDSPISDGQVGSDLPSLCNLDIRGKALHHCELRGQARERFK